MSILTHRTGWCDSILYNTRSFSVNFFPLAAVAMPLLHKMHCWNGRGGGGGGYRGVVERPLASCRGTYSRWYYVLNNTRGVAAQTLSGEPAVPGIIPGGVASQLPLGEATMPGRVSQISPVYSRSHHRLLVYSKVDLIHTSGLVEASASTAYRPQSSGCGGVCGTGFGQDVVVVADGSPVGWFRRCPIPWVAWIDSRGRQLLVGQRPSTAACLDERRGAATGTQSQASLLQLPQPLYGD